MKSPLAFVALSLFSVAPSLSQTDQDLLDDTSTLSTPLVIVIALIVTFAIIIVVLSVAIVIMCRRRSARRIDFRSQVSNTYRGFSQERTQSPPESTVIHDPLSRPPSSRSSRSHSHSHPPTSPSSLHPSTIAPTPTIANTPLLSSAASHAHSPSTGSQERHTYHHLRQHEGMQLMPTDYPENEYAQLGPRSGTPPLRPPKPVRLQNAPLVGATRSESSSKEPPISATAPLWSATEESFPRVERQASENTPGLERQMNKSTPGVGRQTSESTPGVGRQTSSNPRVGRQDSKNSPRVGRQNSENSPRVGSQETSSNPLRVGRQNSENSPWIGAQKTSGNLPRVGSQETSSNHPRVERQNSKNSPRVEVGRQNSKSSHGVGKQIGDDVSPTVQSSAVQSSENGAYTTDVQSNSHDVFPRRSIYDTLEDSTTGKLTTSDVPNAEAAAVVVNKDHKYYVLERPSKPSHHNGAYDKLAQQSSPSKRKRRQKANMKFIDSSDSSTSLEGGEGDDVMPSQLDTVKVVDPRYVGDYERHPDYVSPQVEVRKEQLEEKYRGDYERDPTYFSKFPARSFSVCTPSAASQKQRERRPSLNLDPQLDKYRGDYERCEDYIPPPLQNGNARKGGDTYVLEPNPKYMGAYERHPDYVPRPIVRRASKSKVQIPSKDSAGVVKPSHVPHEYAALADVTKNPPQQYATLTPDLSTVHTQRNSPRDSTV